VSAATNTYVLLRAFVDELARCGLRHACTSPGSRSAPLVLSLAREPRLQCHSHVDERCAGFFALGLAKRSGLPAAVACTSGTAVAELAPAVIEAREARVPLLVLSADRPAELRENGAGQAIDQLKLFGSAAKWFFEVSLDGGAGPQQLRFIRTLACRAYWTALQDRPGAVHLNFPLREPLIVEQELPADHSGRADGRPHVRRTAASASSSTAERELSGLVGEARRGLLIAGRDERRNGLARAAANFAEAAGWPLLADPMSGARRGQGAIAHYDMLLRDARFAAAHEPDLVLRVGDLPVSKPLRGWLAGLGSVEQVALDPEGAWQDPSSSVSRSLALEPAGVLERLAVEPAGGPRGWQEDWRRADELAAGALAEVLDGHALCEPAVAAELGTLLPTEATLFVASSMPVRDIESFWAVREDPPRVLCNRGANGIDGTVSSAFGAAAAGAEPVVLLIGDVALAHDIGGLLAARRLGIALTIVLVNNEGGGIFDFLPVAGIPEQELYDAHVATPTGLDFRHAAELYGLHHEPVDDLDGLRAALGAALRARHASIVEVRTSRAGNVGLHRRIWEAGARALSPQAAGAGPAA
jgi:2-succinyl-5-enolpyruvyl-6-hydroxy-3-cyclohexene-1-carboxylate synthase